MRETVSPRDCKYAARQSIAASVHSNEASFASRMENEICRRSSSSIVERAMLKANANGAMRRIMK